MSAYVQTCSKNRYSDKRAAQGALNKRMNGRQEIRRGRPEFLRVYACPRCGGWHLTHQEEAQ